MVDLTLLLSHLTSWQGQLITLSLAGAGLIALLTITMVQWAGGCLSLKHRLWHSLYSGLGLGCWLNALPYSPARDGVILLTTLFAFGCLLYRIRGGFLGKLIPGGTWPARLLWLMPTSFLLLALADDAGFLRQLPVSHPLSWAVVLIFLILCFEDWLGLMIPHGRQMDLGRYNGSLNDDAWHLYCIGQSRLTFIIAPLAYFDPRLLWLWPVAVGHPLAYLIGWSLPVPEGWRPKLLADGSTSDSSRYLIDHECAWAEYFWGGIQWYGIIWLFLLLGYQLELFGLVASLTPIG